MGIFSLILLFSYCGWTQPINISQGVRGANDGDIAVDKNGVIHVVWRDYTIGDYPTGEILYRWYDGVNFGPIYNVSRDGDAYSDGSPEIAVDDSGNVYVTWEKWVGLSICHVMFSYFKGDTWSLPIKLCDSLRPFDPTLARVGDILVDRGGKVHIVWSDNGDGNFEVFHTIFYGDSFSVPENVSNSPNYTSGGWLCTRLEEGLNNEIHLVFKEDTPPGESGIAYSEFINGNWTTPEIVSNPPGYDGAIRTSVNPITGNLWVTWEGASAKIYVIHQTDTGWTRAFEVETLSGETEGFLPAIGIDGNGVAHVIWSAVYSNLWEARCEGDSWYLTCDISGTPWNSGAPSIVRDINGNLHMVWTEVWSSDTFDIFYSRFDATDIRERIEIKGRGFLNRNNSDEIFDITGRKIRFIRKRGIYFKKNKKILVIKKGSSP